MASQFTVTCPLGAEDVLVNELKGLGIQRTKTSKGAVQVFGKLKAAYKACLWSRVASRVLWELARFEALTAEQLYDGLRAIPWHEHIPSSGTLWVDFHGRSKHIRNETFGAQKSKDAIVDQIRDAAGERPSIAKDEPDVRVHIRLHHGLVTAQIDLSGRPLHFRTPGKHVTRAPLKENLASTILYLADWPRRAAAGEMLLDPMCGSGTFVLEAAEMASGRAPGLNRDYWGFAHWLGHQRQSWSALREDALSKIKESDALICGSDIDAGAVRVARHNATVLGLEDIRLQQRDVFALTPPKRPSGILVTNPPYGTRLGDLDELVAFYAALGDVMKSHLDGWDAYIFCPANVLSKSVGLKTKRRHPLMNGAIDCRLLHFPIQGKSK